ncbi:MAG: DUF2290 domain-containing protein [Methylococcaceae bacterium]|nr:DUF2290 domain-containing protein [Methylococcaceae bacterium]
MYHNTKIQIEEILKYLVETSLANDQQFPIMKVIGNGLRELTLNGAEHISVAMKDYDYKDIYDHLVKERAFSALLLDGALIQMMYVFDGDNIQRHRLTFFPSPYLDEFQNNPEIYMMDEVFADVIARNLVPFPIRFDFDGREGVHQPVEHPKSHLTLGQYESCRIPVTAAMTPYLFINFILRNFYNTAFKKYSENLPISNFCFQDSILEVERDLVHISLPK